MRGWLAGLLRSAGLTRLDDGRQGAIAIVSQPCGVRLGQGSEGEGNGGEQAMSKSRRRWMRFGEVVIHRINECRCAVWGQVKQLAMAISTVRRQGLFLRRLRTSGIGGRIG